MKRGKLRRGGTRKNKRKLKKQREEREGLREEGKGKDKNRLMVVRQKLLIERECGERGRREDGRWSSMVESSNNTREKSALRERLENNAKEKIMPRGFPLLFSLGCSEVRGRKK